MTMTRLGAALLLSVPFLVTSSQADELFTVTEKMAQISGWTVGYNETTGRCAVIGEYDNNTRLSVGRLVTDETVFLALSNDSWKSIVPGNGYDLKLAFAGAKPISAKMTALSDQDQNALFSSELHLEVLTTFANAIGLEVFYQNNSLGRFGLKGTKRAVREIEKCVTAVSSRQTSDPFASGTEPQGQKPAAQQTAAPETDAAAASALAAPAPAPTPDVGSAPLINFAADWPDRVKAFTDYLKGFDELERSYDAQRRYYSWCCKNMKKGPSKGDDMDFGLYSDNGDGPRIPDISPAILADPGMAALQTSYQSLAEAYEEAVPVINEAESYYEKETYRIDDGEQAREIHSRLHPLLQKYRAAYIATAKLILANFQNYTEIYLPALLKEGDEKAYAYMAAFTAYKKYTLAKRTSVKGKALKTMLTDVQQTIGEYKRFVETPMMDDLIGAAESTIKNCTEEFWIRTGQCENSPFD